MKVKALGSSGGKTPEDDLTSYLIDGRTLLDAGGSCAVLTERQQLMVDRIFISHPHLDHIYSLGFFFDTISVKRKKPVEIISIKPVLDIIKNNLLNDILWRDYSKGKNPIAKYRAIEPYKKITAGPYKVEAIPVNHPVPAVGFVIGNGRSTLFYTGDMGPTPHVWEIIKTTEPKINALLTELSFPNAMSSLALLSGHLTPDMLEDGMIAAGITNIPVYISHMKPQFTDKLISELDRLPRKNVHVVQDGQTFAI